MAKKALKKTDFAAYIEKFFSSLLELSICAVSLVGSLEKLWNHSDCAHNHKLKKTGPG